MAIREIIRDPDPILYKKSAIRSQNLISGLAKFWTIWRIPCLPQMALGLPVRRSV